MSQIQSKQVKRILAASIKILGVSVTASNSSVVVTTPITSALTTAGDGGTSVPLVVSSGFNSIGVVTSTPLNLTGVWNNTTKLKITTTAGFEVYGRLTSSAGVYTLSFYYLDNTGAETPFIFSANTTVDFDFSYRYEFHQLPSDAMITQFGRNVYQDPKGSGGGVPQIEVLGVFSLNTLAPLSNAPSDTTKLTLVVNGQWIDALGGGSAAFSVSGGVNITWSAVNAGFNLETTDRVIAIYYL